MHIQHHYETMHVIKYRIFWVFGMDLYLKAIVIGHSGLVKKILGIQDFDYEYLFIFAVHNHHKMEQSQQRR